MVKSSLSGMVPSKRVPAEREGWLFEAHMHYSAIDDKSPSVELGNIAA
jgi:hypothetical protein